MTGPRNRRKTIAEGIADAIDSDQFEHYLPDMKADHRGQDVRHRQLHCRHARLGRLGRDGTVKALLFGAPPDKEEVRPTPEDELETMLAGIPFGLHDIDDARLVRPDWVVTKPILSGICGSDAKLVLGDFNTGDIDNPWPPSPRSPTYPGTRSWPRSWPSDRRPAGSMSGSASSSTRG